MRGALLRWSLTSLPLIFFFITAWAQEPGDSRPWGIKKILYQSQVFSRDTLWQSNIYLKEGPKLKSKRLIKGAENPAWSPDGQKVAFLLLPYEECDTDWICANQRHMAGLEQIQVINADGSGGKMITNVPVGVVGFAWSPVRNEIAYFEQKVLFERKAVGRAVIVRINADGSERKELAVLSDSRCPKPSVSTEPSLSWSPDGESIAFNTCAEGRTVISLVGRNGGDPHPLVNGYGGLWSPDGKRLLFRRESERIPQEVSIWVANADGIRPNVVPRRKEHRLWFKTRQQALVGDISRQYRRQRT